MRWDSLDVGHPGGPEGPAARVPLPLLGDSVRVYRPQAPQFRGITFYEVHARSVVNRVPDASRMPFRWTINPYRGCSHACVYCFARQTHTYLDLDAGADFDSQIVVKVNAAEVLRRELAGPRWQGEHIAMGTNVDCYQRAEGRYRLMRGILAALRDFANPFSILTKGSLILRDLDLLRQAAEVTEVATNVSVGFVDQTLWRRLEPGTPSPQKRLAVCRTLTEAGIDCGVLMAPVLPFLTDAPSQLEAAVRAIAAAGATRVSPIVLHLRPGAREWFMAWLGRHHPDLVRRYDELYAGRSYAPTAYQREVTGRVHELAARCGLRPATPAGSRTRPAGRPSRSRTSEGAAPATQLSLL